MSDFSSSPLKAPFTTADLSKTLDFVSLYSRPARDGITCNANGDRPKPDGTCPSKTIQFKMPGK